MRCLHTDAHLSRVEEVQDFVIDHTMQMYGVRLSETPEKNFHIRLVLEELFVNICSYAYPENTPGTVNICVDKAGEESDLLHIFIQDYGVSFNPLLREEPDLCREIESRAVGGLGIHFVRELTKNILYERRDESNILHLYIKL